MNAAPLSETLKELTDLCKLFANAEVSLKKGEVIDMTGVDKRVASVCQKVQQAMPEQQKEYLPEMNALINLLSVYERALRDAYPDFADKSNASG